ncbi:hypothetical protein [Planctomicrobium sp. SH527]|uniref:hypothetical protein n=1 Tax=Planctomicrobium sp. SH527 TaxID=3448123 RepID=UPI003F5C5630
MGKLGLASASLVAAVPGVALFAILVLAMSNHMGAIPTAFQVVMGLVMLAALVAGLMPLYILVMYRGRNIPSRKNAALATAGAGAVGGGAAAGSFGEDDQFGFGNDSEQFGETAEFQTDDHFEAEEDFDAGTATFETDEFESDSAGSFATEEFATGDALAESAQFGEDDFLDNMTSEFETNDDADPIEAGGGGLDDDFNFELFDDEDDNKKK